MTKKERLYWMCLAILVFAAATVLLLTGMVTVPGRNIVDLSGDAGKNYFSFIYHAVYDKGVWFHGMNYPYGDHVIYADGQPLISTLINLVAKPTAPAALAAMNLIISFSYFLAMVFTYKILLRFGVGPLVAIIFSCLILIVSPQVLRLRAHFALSYACFIPMIFYLNIRYHDTRNKKWLLWMFLTGYIMTFIHLYLGAMLFLWLAFYILGSFLSAKGKVKDRIRSVVPACILLIALLFSFKATVYLTDPIKDRPTAPLGFLSNLTLPQDILISQFSPIWQWMVKLKVLPKMPEHGEGYGYIGVVSTFVVLIVLAGAVIRKARKQSSPEATRVKVPAIWLFVACCALALSMGVPFVWHMEWLIDYLSVFKQFRSMGRFNWIFYYVISVYVVVMIYQWYTAYMAKDKRILAYAILIGCIAVWSVDASGYIHYTHDFMEDGWSWGDKLFHNKEKKWSQYLAEKNYKPTDLQGIICLPFYANGSEKLWIGDEISCFPQAISASLEMNLPIVDIMMSRTSWSETEHQAQTVGGPYTDKPMLRDAKNNKPFLLLIGNGATINYDEAYLLKASDDIGNYFNSEIYVCYPDRIAANDKKCRDSVVAVLPYVHTKDTCLVNKGPWHIDHLDKDANVPHIFGDGGATAIKEDQKVIDTFAVEGAMPNQLYELSCWFRVPGDNFSTPYITLQLLDSSGKCFRNIDMLTKRSTDFKDFLWFRSYLYFNVPPECKAIAMLLVKQEPNCYSAANNLMLRPADAVIISKDNKGKVMVNNHFLE